MKPSLAIGGTLTTVFLASTALIYAVSPRVTERDAAMKIVRGQLVNAQVDEGVKMDAILPHVEYIRLPKFLQTTEVSAGEKDAVTIRTKEDARIYGTFRIKFSINNADPNFGKIYTELKADEIEDLFPHIEDYTIPAAIDVYKDIKTSDVNNDLPGVGKKIAEKLQGYLNERGYTYIVISDVVPSGVGLSDKANADLENIVSEERKLDLQKTQEEVAKGALATSKKQTELTIAAYKQLREAGVPDSMIPTMYYLQMMRDTDKVGQPFTPIPFAGSGTGTVAAVPAGTTPAIPAPGR